MGASRSVSEALYRQSNRLPNCEITRSLQFRKRGAETDNVGLQFSCDSLRRSDERFPDGTQYADYANPHNYVSSTRKIYVDNQAWNAADPTLNGPWDGCLAITVSLGVTILRGYSNDDLLALATCDHETGWDSVSDIGGERTQGIVLVNTYLAQFKRGWRYTFIYQLRELLPR